MIKIDRHDAFPTGGKAVIQFIIAKHRRMKTIVWSGMKRKSSPTVVFLRELTCCQHGCDAPISGFVDNGILFLAHPFGHSTVAHNFGSDIICRSLPNILSFKLARHRCRVCHVASNIIKPFKHPNIVKCRGGLVFTVDSLSLTILFTFDSNSLRFFPGNLLPKTPFTTTTFADIPALHQNILTLPGATHYKFCKDHHFSVAYPILLCLKKCPCGNWHSCTTVPSSSYEYSFRNLKVGVKYKLWNLDRPPTEKVVTTRRLIKSSHSKRLIFYSTLSQKEADDLLPRKVCVVHRKANGDIYPSVFEAEVPVVAECEYCLDRKSRTLPVCKICRSQTCDGCEVEQPLSIPKQYIKDDTVWAQCFKCGWLDDGHTMAAFDDDFPYDREGVEGTLYLCSSCAIFCERCGKPSPRNLCGMCQYARDKANAYSIVHSDMSHMRTSIKSLY